MAELLVPGQEHAIEPGRDGAARRLPGPQLPLNLFGGTVLEGFAFALLVAIVAGTWSTVFVAAPVAGLLAATASRRTPKTSSPRP